MAPKVRSTQGRPVKDAARKAEGLAQRREPAGGELERLCKDLRGLLRTAELSQTQALELMGEKARLRRSQLSDLLSARIANPPDWDHVRAIVAACGATGKLSPAEASEQDWRKRLENVVIAHEALRQRDAAERKPPLPRILDPDSASLQAQRFPQILRRDLLDRALRARDRQAASAGYRMALVLTGDGGIGKSVLLGQLLQRLKDTRGAVVFISCAQVSLEALSRGASEADRALGEAVHLLSGMGIIEILTSLRHRHESVTLLVDTLDLILSRRSLPGLSAVLAQALELGDVVLTCREHEYQVYLAQGAPRLAGRLTRYVLPLLSAHEIVHWAEDYVTARNPELTASDAAFLRALEGRMAAPGQLRQVCALPVRLAMACDVYAGWGHIPPDLTATRLFGAYWDARVRRTPDGIEEPAKERAALAMAEAIVKSGGALALRVPNDSLIDKHDAGLRLLASEGVIRDLGTHWEFFHQSFAEYTHGRWLLRQGGPDSDRITRFVRALESDETNLWPLARSLLSQVDGFTDYQQLAARLPADTAEAAQAHMVAALGRAEEASVHSTLTRLGREPDLMVAVLPVLGEAPDRYAHIACQSAVDAFREHPGELAQPATLALASLLPRIPSGDLPRQLEIGLAAAISARRHLDGKVWENLPAKLLAALDGARLPDGVLTVVEEFYSRLSPLARREAVRAYLRHPLLPWQVANFARRALSVECPPLPDDDAVRLMCLFWGDEGTRTEHGWSSWRDLLTAPLPGRWDNAQVKFVAQLGAQDVTVCAEIVNDIVQGEGTELTRHVNVLDLLTAHHPEWIATHVLAQAAPRRAGVGSLAYTMKGIQASAETRLRLLEWLVPGRVAAPKNVWPAQIVLAGDCAEAHLRILDDLAASTPPRDVVASMLRAWVSNSPQHILSVLASRLRSMMTAADGQTRARLEGRLAPGDPQAREWLADALIRGASSAVAGTAIKTLQHDVSGHIGELATLLVTLLDSPHTDAVMRLAEILLDPHRVTDEDIARVADTLPEIALGR
jgi:hypothetical protein